MSFLLLWSVQVRTRASIDSAHFVVCSAPATQNARSSDCPAAFPDNCQLHRLKCAAPLQYPREDPLGPPDRPPRRSLLHRCLHCDCTITTHSVRQEWPLHTVARCLDQSASVEGLQPRRLIQSMGDGGGGRRGDIWSFQEGIYRYERSITLLAWGLRLTLLLGRGITPCHSRFRDPDFYLVLYLSLLGRNKIHPYHTNPRYRHS